MPGSVVPTQKWFRIRKCKPYVLVNRAERRKVRIGRRRLILVTSWNTIQRYKGLVYIPSTSSVVFFAHVLFDEKILNRQSDYIRAIVEMAVKVALEEKRLESNIW